MRREVPGPTPPLGAFHVDQGQEAEAGGREAAHPGVLAAAGVVVGSGHGSGHTGALAGSAPAGGAAGGGGGATAPNSTTLPKFNPVR